MLDGATVTLLPALTIYLGLNAGGYFAGSTGWAAAALAIALAVRVAVSARSLIAPSRPLLLAAGGLGLLALWTLLSGEWSGNYGRALIEFDRALLYLLVLLHFGLLTRPRFALRFLPLGFALAAVILCGAGLVTRLLPDLWPFDLPMDGSRLAYPVTYSNGLGILASLGMISCLHVASWEREWAAARVLAAAALPLLAATLLLTFSRGAILAAAIGALLYVVLGRPRGLPAALLAIVPFVVLAAHAAYGADLLSSESPTRPAAIAQGEEVAATVGLSMLGAAVCLGLLLPLERWVTRRSLPRPSRRLSIGVAVALAIGVAAAGLIWAPDAVRELREELRGQGSTNGDLTRDRLAADDLGDLGGQNRVDYWQVSLDAFEQEPLRGTGVGTFAERWASERPIPESVTEGHSVYLETLGELGLIGAALLTGVLVILLAGFIAGLRRGNRRPLYAAALGAAAAWLIHAAIDWDWELPVLTVWLFAFGGCALAVWRRRRAGARRSPPGWARALAAAACGLAAVTPATIAVSQSRLDASVAALLRGDCGEAERLAASASSTLPPRAEPYEILAYCHSRAGEHARAVAMISQAIDRDPGNWELRYGLALVRGAAGKDPSGAVRQLTRMNPLERFTVAAAERFAGEDPARWRRLARDAPLPLP